MKKIFIILLMLLFSSSCSFGLEEEILLEKENPTSSFLENIIKVPQETMKLEIERTDVIVPLFKKYLTKEFENSPVESLHLWGAFNGNFTTQFNENSDTDTCFKASLVNIVLDGKFKGSKESFRILLDPTPIHEEFFQQFVKDIYIQTSRIPHHTVLLGNSRTGVGYEGAQSPFTLPLASRAQISRNLGNIRKVGLRVKGDYSLLDYDFGGYSSDTFFREFFPGVEFDGWANLKPLGKTDGRWGKVVAGGGIVAGESNDINYFQSGASLSYEYKNLWARAEWASANGSNGGSGLTKKHSDGMYGTIGYFVTPKFETIARYDQFRADKTQKDNYQREYTLGANYYIKGQSLKLLFNYIYCQKDTKPDSHKLIVGTQIIL